MTYFYNRHRSSTFKKFTPGKRFKQNPYDRFVGVEIETDIKTGTKAINRLSELHKKWSVVYDGSIGGQEFVSKPMNGDILFSAIDGLTKELNERKYKITKSDGLHIHLDITKEKENLKFLKNLVAFYTRFEPYILMMQPNSRWHSTYCKLLNSRGTRNINKLKRIEDMDAFKCFVYKKNSVSNCGVGRRYSEMRYEGINFHSIFFRGTIEIRYHSGTIEAEKIKNWILMHLRILKLCKTVDPEEMLNIDNNQETFLKLFNNNLQTYITERHQKFNEANKVDVEKLKENNKRRFKNV